MWLQVAMINHDMMLWRHYLTLMDGALYNSQNVFQHPIKTLWDGNTNSSS